VAIYLADTNILLRFAQRSDPLHSQVRSSLRQLRQDGHELKITTQNCIEFWNVTTRPASRNGFGLTPVQADRLLRILERLFPLVPDSPSVYIMWRSLVVRYGVSGVQVHDARLVATMKVNGINYILTFNITDFTRYASEGIISVTPVSL
jgi:predicted nucleic acid-binding protein